MTDFCINHPQNPTKRKCFYCQDFICPECQILAKHHYFCSFKCYRKFYRISLLKSISLWLRKPIELPIFLFRDLIKIVRVLSWNWLFNLFFTMALAFSLWMLFSLRNELQALRSQVNVDSKNSYKNIDPLVSNTSKFSILKPNNGGMVLTNHIDIEGEAENDHIISLLVDGELKAVTLPQNGRFKFENIPAKRGNNVFTVKSLTKGGEVTSLETIHIKYNNPTLRYLSRNITRGNYSEPKVALTFDGGYLANACDEILNILKEKSLKCTIFLSGNFIKRNKKVVKRMIEDGHEIGNHTWSHPHLTDFVDKKVHITKSSVTREFLQDQLRKTANTFRAYTGTSLMPFWRAPYGEHNQEIREWAAELGYRHIGWTFGPSWQKSMDTMDWVADTTSSAYHTADEILDKILNFGKSSAHGANGSIIIMHLGTERDHDFPHKKLPEIIDGLRKQGYKLTRVSELLK